MRTGGHRFWHLAAVLLAASALQGCAGANVLAAIDGPYVPPSERTVEQQVADAALVSATLAELAPVSAPPEPAPELEPASAVAQVDPQIVAPQIVGPVLAAAELAPPPAPAEPPTAAPPPTALVVPEVFVEPGPDVPAAATSRIERGFLAPAPAAADPTPAARVADGGLIGPALPGPEAPVRLATRLPSVFDLPPPPVVETGAEPALAPPPRPRPPRHRPQHHHTSPPFTALRSTGFRPAAREAGGARCCWPIPPASIRHCRPAGPSRPPC